MLSPCLRRCLLATASNHECRVSPAERSLVWSDICPGGRWESELGGSDSLQWGCERSIADLEACGTYSLWEAELIQRTREAVFDDELVVVQFALVHSLPGFATNSFFFLETKSKSIASQRFVLSAAESGAHRFLEWKNRSGSFSPVANSVVFTPGMRPFALYLAKRRKRNDSSTVGTNPFRLSRKKRNATFLLREKEISSDKILVTSNSWAEVTWSCRLWRSDDQWGSGPPRVHVSLCSWKSKGFSDRSFLLRFTALPLIKSEKSLRDLSVEVHSATVSIQKVSKICFRAWPSETGLKARRSTEMMYTRWDTNAVECLARVDDRSSIVQHPVASLRRDRCPPSISTSTLQTFFMFQAMTGRLENISKSSRVQLWRWQRRSAPENLKSTTWVWTPIEIWTYFSPHSSILGSCFYVELKRRGSFSCTWIFWRGNSFNLRIDGMHCLRFITTVEK